MKTLAIFSNYEELPKFILLDGDHSQLDKIVLGTDETEEQAEAFEKVFYPVDNNQIEMQDKIPEDFNPKEHKQINVGFAP